ncbi:DUF5806 family protein [Halorarum halobium]|uniref:DUF5806 family protein n=1 Tax=Halorarum halobium TaxID=3075121 RepID=UPI0028B0090C|nr:DUF5806 family protein [Halobaculum sp. XH14]
MADNAGQGRGRPPEGEGDGVEGDRAGDADGRDASGTERREDVAGEETAAGDEAVGEGTAGADGAGATEDEAVPGDEPISGDEVAPGDEPAPGEDPAAGDDAARESPPGSVPGPDVDADVPADVRKYDRFQKMERAEYDRVNEFLRDRTYVTAREWAIARLCADFRTETGVEMTKIGENLPRLVPFMTDTYTPQAVNQARASFEEKVNKAGATFLYGAMCGFFTAEQLDDMMYEVTEVAKFLLEVEGVDLAVEDELEAEDRISTVMREVRQASAEVRGEEVKCPECGHVHES